MNPVSGNSPCSEHTRGRCTYVHVRACSTQRIVHSRCPCTDDDTAPYTSYTARQQPVTAGYTYRLFGRSISGYRPAVAGSYTSWSVGRRIDRSLRRSLSFCQLQLPNGCGQWSSASSLDRPMRMRCRFHYATRSYSTGSVTGRHPFRLFSRDVAVVPGYQTEYGHRRQMLTAAAACCWLGCRPGK